MLVADRAQAFEIAFRRRQHAGRGGDRLDDDGRNGGGVMQRHQPLERVGQMAAPFRLADGESLLGAVIGHRQMIDAGEQRAAQLAVPDDAADRDAAEADAVITALAANQPHARGVAAHIVKRQCDLERAVDRLRAGIAEEHMIEVAGGERGDAARQLERLGVRKLERRRVVELGRLALDRRHDRLAVMAGIGAPQPGGAVDQLAAFGCEIVHVLGASDQARARLERPIGRERHPIGLEIVGNRGGCDARFTHGHGAASLLFAWVVHIGLSAFSDNDKAGNGCYHAGNINFSDSVEWPNRPSSKPACRAASPTAGRPRSPPPGTWWKRSAWCSSATASSRWRRRRSNTPTRSASSCPTRTGRTRACSRSRTTTSSGSRCATIWPRRWHPLRRTKSARKILSCPIAATVTAGCSATKSRAPAASASSCNSTPTRWARRA